MPPEVGVILAGGQSRRMGGGDKCLRPLGGRPILAHVIERARPQVAALILNANGDPARFLSYGLPVVGDPIPGFAGPLVGVLAGLEWTATHAPSAEFVVSFAADAPFVPRDLVARLSEVAHHAAAELAVATSAGQVHPVIGLWKVSLRQALRSAIVDEDIRKVDTWTARFRTAVVEFPVAGRDPFFNVNDASDLAEAGLLLEPRQLGA